MTGSKMFSFIDATHNPLGGPCPHECSHCWARALIEKHKWLKYAGPTRIIEKQLQVRFKPGSCVFLVDMRDPCSTDVDTSMILRLFDYIEEQPQASFFMISQNPARWVELHEYGIIYPANLIYGATIETDLDYLHNNKAPPFNRRMEAMRKIRKIEDAKPLKLRNRLFISVEPILQFSSPAVFAEELAAIITPQDLGIAVGYNNSTFLHKLVEPPKRDTVDLCNNLESRSITVYRKTIRRAWSE